MAFLLKKSIVLAYKEYIYNIPAMAFLSKSGTFHSTYFYKNS
jgi:hypothetical protein